MRGSRKLKNRRLLSPKGVVKLSCIGRRSGRRNFVSLRGRCMRTTARQASADIAHNCRSSCCPKPNRISSCMGSASLAKGSRMKGRAPASETRRFEIAIRQKIRKKFMYTAQELSQEFNRLCHLLDANLPKLLC